MDGDVITLGINLIQALDMFDGAGKIPCSINRNVWVISVYFHSKCRSSVCHHCSDGTKTDDTQLLAHDLASCKLLLLLLSKFIDVFLVFLFGTVLYRNIVDTCTCTCDYLYALRKLHVMHFCTSYKDCITLLQIFAFLIFFIK